MKFIKQFGVILAISFIGEIMNYLIPLPVPASIYGLVLMFLALETGILKLEQVRETAKYLIEIMPLMFIPAGVGLLEAWGDLKPIWIQVILIMMISTIAVIGISGRVTQMVIRLERKRKGRHHEGSME